MNISIEAHLLNHSQRSGLMTYTEGLINGMNRIDHDNHYYLLYYSLKRKSCDMPGPSEENGRFTKSVLRVPDQEFSLARRDC